MGIPYNRLAEGDISHDEVKFGDIDQSGLIARRFKDLDNQIDGLDSVISALMDRISPIMGPQNPRPGGSPADTEDDFRTSEIATTIEQATKRVMELRWAMGEVIDRIEL